MSNEEKKKISELGIQLNNKHNINKPETKLKKARINTNKSIFFKSRKSEQLGKRRLTKVTMAFPFTINNYVKHNDKISH